MRRVVMAGRLAPLGVHPTRPAEDGTFEADTEWLAGQLIAERIRKMEHLREFRQRYFMGVAVEPVA